MADFASFVGMNRLAGGSSVAGGGAVIARVRIRCGVRSRCGYGRCLFGPCHFSRLDGPLPSLPLGDALGLRQGFEEAGVTQLGAFVDLGKLAVEGINAAPGVNTGKIEGTRPAYEVAGRDVGRQPCTQGRAGIDGTIWRQIEGRQSGFGFL